MSLISYKKVKILIILVNSCGGFVKCFPANYILIFFGDPQNNSLSFNKYAFLTTHNAFAINDGTPRFTFTNQEDSVTQQLKV